jgi:hypothetical protein
LEGAQFGTIRGRKGICFGKKQKETKELTDGRDDGKGRETWDRACSNRRTNDLVCQLPKVEKSAMLFPKW